MAARKKKEVKPDIELKLNVLENWNDVTFQQWRLLLDAQRRFPTEDDLLELRLEQAQILNPDILIDDLKKLTIAQCKEYFGQMTVVFDKEPIKEVFNQFELDGKVYKLNSFYHLTLEQWIDAEKYSDILMAHKLIAIFYIDPKEYNTMELEKVADYIDLLPCSKVFYLIGQFFFIQKLLEATMDLYLEKAEKKLKWEKKVMEKTKKIKEILNKFGSKLLRILRITTLRSLLKF